MKLLTAKDEKELKDLKDQLPPLPKNLKIKGTGLKLIGKDKSGKVQWIKQMVK
jgi:hypothetical protein